MLCALLCFLLGLDFKCSSSGLTEPKGAAAVAACAPVRKWKRKGKFPGAAMHSEGDEICWQLIHSSGSKCLGDPYHFMSLPCG